MKRPTESELMAFFKAVWPEYTDLQISTSSERECLLEATRLLNEYRAENVALKAEAERDQDRWEWLNRGNLSIRRTFPLIEIQGSDSGGRDHVTVKLWEGWYCDPIVARDFEGSDLRPPIDFIRTEEVTRDAEREAKK